MNYYIGLITLIAMSINKKSLLAGISDEWLKLLDNAELDTIISKLNNMSNNNITPTVDKVFEFARSIEIKNIKCVIIGQDPYPKQGDACGLAFSCLTSIPASIRNIYKCIVYNKLCDNKELITANLLPWAKQGVLLINAALTTKINKSNAHAAIWESYINKLIDIISKLNVIFILWGNFAIGKRIYISNESQILTWSHPSPLATGKKPFMPCDNFNKANELLINKKLTPINWDFNYEYDMSFTFDIDNNIDLMKPTDDISIDVIKTLKLTNTSTVIFTDGSAYPNKACKDSVAAYAAVFAAGMFIDTTLYGSIETDKYLATNQRAEGTAIYKVMLYLTNNINWTYAIIITDSKFWIDMFMIYMPAWSNNKVAFENYKNADLTVGLWSLYQSLQTNKTIEFRHVRGHDKDKWSAEPIDSYKYFCYINNDYVDKLASYNRKKLKPGTHIIDKVKYE